MYNPGQKIIFDERFLSEALVEAKGGIVTGGSFDGGYTVDSDTDRIDYYNILHPVEDFSIRIKKTFTAIEPFAATLFKWQKTAAAANSFIHIFLNSTGNLVARIANESAYRDYIATTALTEGSHDIFVTRTGDTIELWVDGVQLSTTTGGSAVSGVLLLNNATIRSIGDSAESSIGTYERVTMWSRKLADEDIAQLTNGEIIRPFSKIDILYPFQQEVGTTTKTTPDIISGYDLTLGTGTAKPSKLAGRNGYSFDTNSDTMTGTLGDGYLPTCGFVWFNVTFPMNKQFNSVFSFGSEKVAMYIENRSGVYYLAFKIDGNAVQVVPQVTVYLNAGLNFVAFSYIDGNIKIMLNRVIVFSGIRAMTTELQTELTIVRIPASYGFNNNIYAIGFGSGESITENDMLAIYAFGPQIQVSGPTTIDQDSLVIDLNFALNSLEDQGPNGLDGALAGDMALIRGRLGYGVFSPGGQGYVSIAHDDLMNIDAGTIHVVVDGNDVINDNSELFFIKGEPTNAAPQYMLANGVSGAFDDTYIVRTSTWSSGGIASALSLNGAGVSVVSITKSAGSSKPKLYVNGAYVTDFSTALDFTANINSDPLRVGSKWNFMTNSRSLRKLTHGFVMYSKEQTAQEVADTVRNLTLRLKQVSPRIIFNPDLFGAVIDGTVYSAGSIPNTDITVTNGTFKMVEATVQGKTRRGIECVTAGNWYMEVPAGFESTFGTLSYFIKSGSAGTSCYLGRTNSKEGTLVSGGGADMDGYLFGKGGTQAYGIEMVNAVAAVKLYSANNYHPSGQTKKYQMVRGRSLGSTEHYIDNILVPVTGGANPYVDTSTDYCRYYFAEMDAGDVIYFDDYFHYA